MNNLFSSHIKLDFESSAYPKICLLLLGIPRTGTQRARGLVNHCRCSAFTFSKLFKAFSCFKRSQQPIANSRELNQFTELLSCSSSTRHLLYMLGAGSNGRCLACTWCRLSLRAYILQRDYNRERQREQAARERKREREINERASNI